VHTWLVDHGGIVTLLYQYTDTAVDKEYQLSALKNNEGIHSKSGNFSHINYSQIRIKIWNLIK
jgi:hypothetical protein